MLAAACGGNAASAPTPTPEPAQRVVAAVTCATSRDVVSVTYNGNGVNCDDLVDFVPSRADFERVSQSGDVCSGRTTVGGSSFEEWMPRGIYPNPPTKLEVRLRDGTVVKITCYEDANGNWLQSVEPISPEHQ
ncbi:hypothetical protein HY411_00655 [Candidatus Gottesmanbacteria bacterium]|nr:hypothetical protein [Candidatus Gottesmanbacteria bacterium]